MLLPVQPHTTPTPSLIPHPQLPPLPSLPQDTAYGGAATWVSNDVVGEYDGRIYINLPASCTLMLVQQPQDG